MLELGRGTDDMNFPGGVHASLFLTSVYQQSDIYIINSRRKLCGGLDAMLGYMGLRQ